MITTRAQELARNFAPVGLEQLDVRASLQHRMDDKYVVMWDQFAALAEYLVDTHEVLEIGGHRAFTYDSVYFDSESLGAYRDHIQRRRRRFKVRTRRYVETDTNQLQVKLEGRRAATVKHVVDCDPDLHGSIDPLGWEFVDRCLREAYGFELGGRLDPTLRTSYGRMTFGPPDGAERVTCDFDMALEAVGGPVGWMRDDRVLIEVKSARGNGPANSLLRRLDVRPVSCSKYCVGVAMTVPGVKSNNYRRLIGRHFEVGPRWIPDHLWQQVTSSYEVAAQVDGTVTSVVASGAFVEVFPGVEGLLPISELATDRVVDAREIVQPGDNVRVKIREIDDRRRCLSLSVRRLDDRMLPPRVAVVPTWVDGDAAGVGSCALAETPRAAVPDRGCEGRRHRRRRLLVGVGGAMALVPLVALAIGFGHDRPADTLAATGGAPSRTAAVPESEATAPSPAIVRQQAAGSSPNGTARPVRRVLEALRYAAETPAAAGTPAATAPSRLAPGSARKANPKTTNRGGRSEDPSPMRPIGPARSTPRPRPTAATQEPDGDITRPASTEAEKPASPPEHSPASRPPTTQPQPPAEDVPAGDEDFGAEPGA